MTRERLKDVPSVVARGKILMWASFARADFLTASRRK